MISRLLVGAMVLAMLTSCSEQVPDDVNLSWQSMRDVDARDWPDKLSEWNVLAISNRTLLPLKGVEPYQLNTSLFSDYAQKFRTLWLPKETALSVTQEGELEFPLGAIITKTFYYQSDTPRSRNPIRAQQTSQIALSGVALAVNHLVETRLLVNTDYGWVGLPYVWNAEQSDATLEIAGGRVPVVFRHDDGKEHEFSYGVPNILECSGCHTPNHSDKRIKPIGPTLANLNVSQPHPGSDQLQRFIERKWLPDSLDLSASLARWDDPSASLTARARAYLQVNCAHCHNPMGSADTSGLYLGYGSQLGTAYGLCKPPVAAGKGSGGLLVDVFPGAPEKSILSYRLHSRDPGEMMPEIGRTLVHTEGVTLIDKWIAGLAGSCQITSQKVVEKSL